MMNHKYDIAILLPTRGRTEALGKSVRSLIELADIPARIELKFAFDRDDEIGKNYFTTELKPWLDQRKIHYTAKVFEPLGYVRLHVYNNTLAKETDSNWLVIWNDDAIMQTQSWDTEIMKHQGEFKLLAFHTHLDHPYSIFPIVPYEWYNLLGYISPHAVQDAWLSQQAYMLDIWERIPVWVEHDRHDLTGNNDDDTYKNRQMLEGKPTDPDDFHSIQQMDIRHRDCFKMAALLKNKYNADLTFFENVFKGTQDPWEKLAANDINKQMVQFDNPHSPTSK